MIHICGFARRKLESSNQEGAADAERPGTLLRRVEQAFPAVAAWIVTVAGALVLFTGEAAASDIDGMEHLFGATNVNAMIGNGGLSVGVARTGELTVFKWPSPSFYDQVHYLTSHEQDAREQPYFGARPNEGIFTGLSYDLEGGGKGVLWFRDASETSQAYLHDESGAVVTTAIERSLGLTAVATAFVRPDQDLLVMQVEVTLSSDSPVKSGALLAYENLSPCLDKYPMVPVTDWFMDFRNDFGVMIDASRGALIHFKPEAGDLSLLDPYMSSGEDDGTLAERVSEEVDVYLASLGTGIYVAMGADRQPFAFQAGSDAEHRCLETPNSWTRDPVDAFHDAENGWLGQSPVAGCQSNGLLAFKLDLEIARTDRMTLFFAVAGEAPLGDSPLDHVIEAADTPFLEHLLETDLYWSDMISQAFLPDTPDPNELSFAKRTLISVHQGTDRHTGAIVASIATQPPYGEDWPRDSAFFNYALDVAGFPEQVTVHNQFMASVQNRDPRHLTPVGAWFMNYYADGIPGGPVPFEIDEVGLAVWSLWTHAKFISDLETRLDYLESVFPAIDLAGGLMLRCKDETNDLQCLANEDDNPLFTQGLQGAETVYLGLKSAAAATRAMCGDPQKIVRYEARAEALRVALVDSFYNEDTGAFEGGSRAWAIWPAKVLPYDDPRMQSTADAIYSSAAAPLYQENDGGSYQGKTTLALARIWGEAPDRLLDAAELTHILAAEVPTAGTHHVGEVFMNLDMDGDGELEYDNRTAVPHLWTATLTYLSLMAVHNPERLEAFESDDGYDTHCGETRDEERAGTERLR